MSPNWYNPCRIQPNYVFFLPIPLTQHMFKLYCYWKPTRCQYRQHLKVHKIRIQAAHSVSHFILDTKSMKLIALKAFLGCNEHK